MTHEITVGQTLFRETKHRHSEAEITEHTVIKIGRKYFEVTGLRHKINISDLKYESPMSSQNNCQLYLSRQEILDRREYYQLYGKIQSQFKYYNSREYSLAELREVARILGI